MSDGIEIHYDPKSGRLDLGCEPDAFAPYRALALKQLEDFPDIRLEYVVQINVIDSEAHFAKRAKFRSPFRTIVVGTALAAVGALAVFGAVVLIGRIAA
jgi:hypothetical protein